MIELNPNIIPDDLKKYFRPKRKYGPYILRNTLIWYKPNHMPSSVKDRFTNSYEPVFMLVKSQRYWFDLDAIRVPHTTHENRPMGIDREKDYPNAKRNRFAFNYRVRDAKKEAEQCPQFKASEEEIKKYKQTKIPKEQAETFGSPRARYHRKTKMEALRETGMVRHGDVEQGSTLGNPEKWNTQGKNPGDLWTIPTQPFPQAHFATFPEKLVEPMIMAGCPEDGIVLDPFAGSATTCVVAKKLGRQYIGIELSSEYIKIAEKRLLNTMGKLI